MSLEITTAGAFSGYGKTVPPSVISIVFTALRIPLALILVHTTLALNGIWWSITISSILKGVLLFVWFYIFMRGEKIIYNREITCQRQVFQIGKYARGTASGSVFVSLKNEMWYNRTVSDLPEHSLWQTQKGWMSNVGLQ